MNPTDLELRVAAIEERLRSTPTDTPTAHTIAEIILEAVRRPEAGFTTVSEIVQALQELIGVFKLLNNGLILSSFGELFNHHITRQRPYQIHYGNVTEYIAAVVKKGEDYQRRMLAARQKIAKECYSFIGTGYIVMTHSYSRVVLDILKKAATEIGDFHVLVAESKPGNSGETMVQKLKDENIPCTLIHDTQVGCMMVRVDMVLVGAEILTQAGGIVNKVGTFSMAVVARKMNKSFYVAAESFKMSRCYPIDQTDLERMLQEKESPIRDYTHPELITLVFTDLGIMPATGIPFELNKEYE